ncbi:cadherin-like domain-containing protein, partial [Oceanithermus sp.]|uniref:Ig-like domain-containing protein n=1 Tax=Oceanithermus sp. TaxID=2268145 RepID=UPI00257D33EA
TVDDGGTPNDPTDDTIVYTPDPDYNGPDSFSYQICDSDGDCATATVNVTVVPSADLSIDKQADAVAQAGQTLTYTLVIRNAGPGPAANATVTDTVPAAFIDPEFSTDGGATWSAWAGSVNLGTIASGTTVTLYLRGQVDPQYSGTLENRASVASDTTDPNPDDNEDAVSTQIAPRPSVQLLLHKTVTPETVRVGDVLTYTLWVNNPSDVRVTFDLVDTPDAHLSYVGGSADPAEPTVTNGRLVWAGLQLDPGAAMKVTYRMRVLAGAGSELENRAQVRAQEHDTYVVAAAQALAVVELADAVFAERRATLVGRVYFDLDRNGVFDPGRDRPLPGARVLLAGGRQVVTDANGNYAFREVPAGVWMVVLDEASAPFEPLPHPEATLGGYTHRVSAWGLTVSDFPLAAPAGTVAAIRSTVLRYGPLTLTKTLIPLDEGRYRVVLHLTSERAVSGVVVVDPLPEGGERRFTFDEPVADLTRTYELEGRAVLTDPELYWRGQ